MATSRKKKHFQHLHLCVSQYDPQYHSNFIWTCFCKESGSWFPWINTNSNFLNCSNLTPNRITNVYSCFLVLFFIKLLPFSGQKIALYCNYLISNIIYWYIFIRHACIFMKIIHYLSGGWHNFHNSQFSLQVDLCLLNRKYDSGTVKSGHLYYDKI